MKLNEHEIEVVIPDGDHRLKGILGLPPEPKGLVIFAHGSGSGRFSIRNNAVARELQKSRLATLLLDLLTQTEAEDRSNVFDLHLLARRLILAKDWILQRQKGEPMKIAYFGASTGAGAALLAAAKDPSAIFAVISRGGRPDLAGEFLSWVRTPTLLIVGGRDEGVIELNEDAYRKLKCEKEFRIIEGATHLFEEPGAMEQVAKIAKDWFLHHAPKSISSLIPDSQFI